MEQRAKVMKKNEVVKIAKAAKKKLERVWIMPLKKKEKN